MAFFTSTSAMGYSSVRRSLAYSAVLTLASLVSYTAATRVLALTHNVSRGNILLGGMWATISTIFVLRPIKQLSEAAIKSRSLATVGSAFLCLLYFSAFPPTAFGLASVVGIGSVVLSLLHRDEQIITAGITTAVIFVAAVIGGGPAWSPPLFRVLDTMIGVLIGYLASHLLGIINRWLGLDQAHQPARI